MRILVLGPVAVSLGVDTAVGSSRRRSLLACLTAAVGRRVTWSELTEGLWGGSPPPSARAALQVHASGVRSLLEPDRAPRSSGSYLVTDSEGYTLGLEVGELDWTRFTRFGEYARVLRSAGRAEEAVELLAAGLNLWRGSAFEDVVEPTPTVVAHGRWLESLRLQAEEDLFAASLAAGRHSELTGDLARALSEEPFRERRAALLMLALYRSGRQRDALEVYNRTRNRLVEEVGCEPGPELGRLHGLILNHDARLDGLRLDPGVTSEPGGPVTDSRHESRVVLEGPSASLLEMEALLTVVGRVTERGAGRFTVVGDRDRLLGVIEAELGREGPTDIRYRADEGMVTVSPLLTPPVNLIGRGDESDRLRAMLGPESVVVSLVGPVGVGKTSLALAVDPSALGAKGRIVVAFPRALGAEEVIEVLMGAVGVSRRPLGDPISDLAAALEGSLLVLDDHDRGGPAVDSVLSSLLQGDRTVRVLTTGRRPSEIANHVLALEPLPVPAPDDPAEVAAECASVRLLVERMGRLPIDSPSPGPSGEGAGPTAARSPGPSALSDIGALARRLDGLPLALELAAPAVTALGPVAVAERLERSPGVLRRPRTDGRHSSLDAALAWALEDLEPRAREVLARLSAFSGGFDLEAAEEVCSGGGVSEDDVVLALAELVNAWLVSNRDPAGYRLLDSTRAVARAWLAQFDPGGETRGRHARYVAARLMRLAPRILGRGGRGARAEIEEGLADLSASLEWMFGAGDDPDTAVDVLGELTFFWFSTGRLHEGRRRTRRALDSGRGSAAGRVRCLVGEAFLAWWQGDYRAVETALSKVVSSSGAEEVPEVAALMDVAWASLAWVDLKLDEAAEHLDRAMEVAAARGQQWELASACTMAANVSWYRGDYRRAVTLYRRAAEVGSRLRNPLLSAVAARGEALMVALDGNPEEALILAQEVLDEGRSLGDPLSEAQSRTFAGLVHLQNGDLTRAIDLMVEALERAVDPFDVMTFLLAGPGLAECALRAGDSESATVLAAWAQTVAQLSSIPMAPLENERCRAALAGGGLEPEASERAAHRGRGLTPDMAAAFARQGRDRWVGGGA